MTSATIVTAVKMLEALPEDEQRLVVDHLRAYILEIQDEGAWDEQFERTQTKLIAAARKAKKEIAEGRAEPMDEKRL